MKKNIKNKKHGFTLVELLVVITILAILASVTVVGYLSFTTRARNSNAVTELTQARELIRAEYLDGDTHYYTVNTTDSTTYEVKNANVSSYNLSFTYNASETASERTFKYATGNAQSTTSDLTVTWDKLLKLTFTELSDMGTFYVNVNTAGDVNTITSIAYKSKTEGYAVWTIASDEIETGSVQNVIDSNTIALKTVTA